MTIDSFDPDRAIGRVRRLIWWLTGLGTAALLAAKGIAWGFGFLLGAAISGGSFHYLHRLVYAINAPGAKKPRAWKAALMGLRYFLIGGILYAMIKLFGLNLVAVLCGLLVTAAAVLLEILYELLHGT
ncbi:MAG: ATP synthase subunit I [Acidobacteria bacterium]|nr:ATP synthase subunit I [Acidobacteriota bacterium]